MWAAEPLLANPVAFCFDEKGRCFVAETFRHSTTASRTPAAHALARRRPRLPHRRRPRSRCTRSTSTAGLREVRRPAAARLGLHGDGKADKASVFADGFNRPEDGLAAGVLARKGNVYFTCIPDLYLLKDTKGDEQGGREEVAGHRLRRPRCSSSATTCTGCAWGRTASSTSRSATAASTSRRRKARSSSTRTAARCCAATRTAATWRSFTSACATRRSWRSTTSATCSPATTTPTPATGRGGSTSSRAATAAGACGYQYGTGYHTPACRRATAGRGTPRSSGSRSTTGQPAYIVPPLLNFGNGPAGITHYPGIGLTDKYKDHFFACDFTGEPRGNSVIWSLAVKPKGASFEVSEPQQFVQADGADRLRVRAGRRVLLARLGRRLGHAGQGPHLPRHRPRGDEEPGRGRGEEAARRGVREEDRSRSWRSCWSSRTSRCGRRRSSSWRRASRKSATKAFAGVLKDSKNQLARLHAVWGLGMVAASTIAMRAKPLVRGSLKR